MRGAGSVAGATPPFKVDMTNTEINRKLALAIGYLPEDMKARSSFCKVFWAGCWRYFSHMAPHTILPIMERYDCHPYRIAEGWNCTVCGKDDLCEEQHENPRTAAALAVIKAKELGLI